MMNIGRRQWLSDMLDVLTSARLPGICPQVMDGQYIRTTTAVVSAPDTLLGQLSLYFFSPFPVLAASRIRVETYVRLARHTRIVQGNLQITMPPTSNQITA